MADLDTTKPYITIDRRDLLRAIRSGRVYKSMGGLSVQMAPSGMNNKRVGNRLRELIAAGWAELGPDDRFYQLTPLGRVDLAAREAA